MKCFERLPSTQSSHTLREKKKTKTHNTYNHNTVMISDQHSTSPLNWCLRYHTLQIDIGLPHRPQTVWTGGHTSTLALNTTASRAVCSAPSRSHCTPMFAILDMERTVSLKSCRWWWWHPQTMRLARTWTVWWCTENNLLLNIDKTKRRWSVILGKKEAVEQVNSFRFLAISITQKLSWTSPGFLPVYCRPGNV